MSVVQLVIETVQAGSVGTVLVIFKIPASICFWLNLVCAHVCVLQGKTQRSASSFDLLVGRYVCVKNYVEGSSDSSVLAYPVRCRHLPSAQVPPVLHSTLVCVC